jgi:hypothetical protein
LGSPAQSLQAMQCVRFVLGFATAGCSLRRRRSSSVIVRPSAWLSTSSQSVLVCSAISKPADW